MTRDLHLNDEQLAELEQILDREEETTRTELRRTDSSEYREGLRHRLDVIRSLCELAHQAEHSSAG